MNVQSKINWINENPTEAYLGLINTEKNAKIYSKIFSKKAKNIKPINGSYTKNQSYEINTITRYVLLEMINEGVKLESLKEMYPSLYEKGGVFYKN
tara:strand:+ start:385 stop:672 length:288 start_codon:yes stop_codon:yes gene_type:complete